jgi:CRP/FNR family cyclic AMP-dependent transcriptional regulator
MNHDLWIARASGWTDLTPLSRQDVRALAELESAEVTKAPAGTVLIRTGEPVETIFVVQRGKVHLAHRHHSGRHVVAVTQSRGVIGDIPLFCGISMPFDAVTADDSTVVAIPTGGLMEFLASSPELCLRWVGSVAKRFAQTQHRIAALLTRDLPARVATVLLEERVSADGEWFVHMAQETMAQLTGVRRQSVARVLGEWRTAGLVSTRYREIVLHDLEGLADVAGEPLESIPLTQSGESV